MSGKYDDIINMPHHVSTRHRPMSQSDRAAQFSPFSALTGYEAALSESARVTDERIELDEQEQQRLDSQVTGMRRSQVGTGMRNERIRTYNFPQGRVTDHRIGLTLYKIDSVMDGDLDEIIDALATADQAEKLKMAKEH